MFASAMRRSPGAARSRALVALLVGSACRPPTFSTAPGPSTVAADLVLTGAAIYTLEPAAPWAEAIAVADGRILAVGSEADALRHRGPATPVVDLAGAMILPGFHDTHVHPVTGGIELGQCDLNGLESVDAVLAKVETCVASGGDDWIVGGGWDLPLFPGANPGRELLDALAPGRAVVLSSADAHSSWLSSEALRRAGITKETPDPANGRIERDAHGAPSGTLREAAMDLVTRHVPPPTAEDHVEGLRRGLQMAARFGITSLHEANATPEVLAAYRTLAERDELTARVVAALHIDPQRGPEQLDALVATRDSTVHPRLRATSIKIFADGVIEAGTAALLRPYVGRPGRGEPTFSPAALQAIVVAADARAFDVHVHAIGDRAVRMSLDAFAAARAANPPWSRRHVIAHLELVDPADLPRFAELGVAASFQPLWAYPDPYITDLTIPVLGPERSRWLYPIGSMLATGATVVTGSDWSVSSMDPLRGLQVAITRREIGTGPGDAWIPEEVATLAPMLAAATKNAAWLLRQDKETGSLAPGKRADLVVLDENLFELPPSEIHRARVMATLVDGDAVYCAAEPRCVIP